MLAQHTVPWTDEEISPVLRFTLKVPELRKCDFGQEVKVTKAFAFIFLPCSFDVADGIHAHL